MVRRSQAAAVGGALLVLVGAGVSGCGGSSGGGDVSGEKLVSGRDISLPFFWDRSTLAYVRATADTSQPEPQDLWTLDRETGTPSVALPGIDWSPPDGWLRSRAGSLLVTGRDGRRFFDFASRQGVDLAAFGMDQMGRSGDRLFRVPGSTTGSSYFPITLIRRDAGAVALATGNSGTVGIGWPTDLKTLTLPGSIGDMAFLGQDLALLFAPYTEGVAAADQTAGIYRLSGATGELAPLVSRPLGDFDGVAGQCATSGRCLFRVVGCAATDAACPGTDRPPCVILYAVNAPDGAALEPHAYDVNTGIDTTLSDAVTRFTVAPDQRRVLWDDRLTTSLNYLDLCSGDRRTCPNMPSGPVVWRPDGNGFAAVDQVNYYFGIASLSDGSCHGEWYPMAVYGLQFSPTGDRLVWVGNSPASSDTPEVWLSAADGAGGAKVAEGDVFGIGYSGDGRRIYIGRAGTSNAGLSWLDPSVSPPVEHLLADNYGGFSAVGSERVLLIDHWNSQDASGELTLIEIDSGARQRIARAVTDMTTAGSVDGDGLDIAYTVRTRVSSDRDGLWLTTLP
jgi:hypothetical protein